MFGIARFPGFPRFRLFPNRASLLSAGFFTILAGIAPADAEVQVRGKEILVDGDVFSIRGASGRERLAELKALGATTVRTYGNETPQVMAEAERLGLKVILGLWMGHPEVGFDYGDRAAVERQLREMRDIVLRYKDSPALLMWGVGNEIEVGLTDHTAIWPAVGEAARMVKATDPDHPTMAVMAEVGGDKIARLKAQAPDIDVLGVNAYGDALLDLPERVRAQGWNGPLLVTELGAHGQWQAEVKPWGAPVELTSTEKAARLRRYLHELAPKTTGQILFLWGQKQEVTPTWHGMFLTSGEWVEAVQVMAEFWDGTTPDNNRAPRIVALTLQAGDGFAPGATTTAHVTGLDPDADPLTAEWQVMAEDRGPHTGTRIGKPPPSFPQAIGTRHDGHDAWSAEIGNLPAGDYRVFVVLRDGRGAAATGNLPFQVR